MNAGQVILMLAAFLALLAFAALLEFLIPHSAGLPCLALSVSVGWLGSALK
jgi:hypothetical protein